MRNRECIKLPECLGCEKVTVMPWKETGSPVRVCRTYRAPRHFWGRGGCPVKIYKHEDGFGNKTRIGYSKRKMDAYLTKKGRVAT